MTKRAREGASAEYASPLTKRETLGAMLQAACAEKRLSHTEAAKRFDVARQEFSTWVNGQRFPSARHHVKVAKFLGITVAALRELAPVSRQDRIDILEEKVAELTALVARWLELNDPKRAEQAPSQVHQSSG